MRVNHKNLVGKLEKRLVMGGFLVNIGSIAPYERNQTSHIYVNQKKWLVKAILDFDCLLQKICDVTINLSFANRKTSKHCDANNKIGM